MKDNESSVIIISSKKCEDRQKWWSFSYAGHFDRMVFAALFLYQMKGEIIMEKTYVHSIRDRPDLNKKQHVADGQNRNIHSLKSVRCDNIDI